MRHFAQTVFELDQTAPANENIDTKSYLPGRTAVPNAFKEQSKESRRKFLELVQNGTLRYGGAVTIDGLHSKAHGKHFYDFTVHYISVKEKGLFADAEFEIKTPTLLIVEGPDSPTPSNIRTCLNVALLQKYEISIDYFRRSFTMVTDGWLSWPA